jgi:hypothetical protein
MHSCTADVTYNCQKTVEIKCYILRVMLSGT